MAELAKIVSANLVGNKEKVISGINTLEAAQEDEVSFLANSRYLESLQTSKAGAICIHSSITPVSNKNYLISEDPSLTFQKIVELFITKSEASFKGIHPSAIIHKSAKIGKNVSIGPYSIIERNVVIKEGTIIYAHVYIGENSKVGENCTIYPSVVIRERCFIGNRVILQPGAIIGSCGFGFSTDKSGKFAKLEQLGTVIIEDDVEIGANTTIDRARFNSTKIGRGTKIDNLVQIAHNVQIGENNGIAAQTGIAGSAKTGNNVLMGGQVGIVGHVEIGDKVMIATRGGVSKSLPQSGQYRGSPAIPLAEYNRQQVYVRKLEEYVNTIKELQKRIEALENRPLA